MCIHEVTVHLQLNNTLQTLLLHNMLLHVDNQCNCRPEENAECRLKHLLKHEGNKQLATPLLPLDSHFN